MKRLFAALVLGISAVALPMGIRHADAAPSANGYAGFCNGMYNAGWGGPYQIGGYYSGYAAYYNSPVIYNGYNSCYP